MPETLTPSKHILTTSCQSEGSERIIQVPGCDDCIGLGHDLNLVSVPVAPPGAGVSTVLIDSGSLFDQKIIV